MRLPRSIGGDNLAGKRLAVDCPAEPLREKRAAMTDRPPTRLIPGAYVLASIDPVACRKAVEESFRQLGLGRAILPPPLAAHTTDGGFHVKAAVMEWRGRSYFSCKTNGNFPANPAQRGLPTIQGVVVLCDANDGRVLALLDSISVTALRTAAASAVAARALARPDSSRLTVVGAGVQGVAHVRALAAEFPLRVVRIIDQDEEAARAVAERLAGELGMRVEALPAAGLGVAARDSDIVATCTSSSSPFLQPDHVSAGTFICAVGTDSPHKSEIHPSVFGVARIVVDELEQCAGIGDLHHAIEAGAMTRDGVHASLADIVAGRKTGRATPDDTILFDSTGLAVQDVAVAAEIYEIAERDGAGATFDFTRG